MEETNPLTPYIDVRVAMPHEMMMALNGFEMRCICASKKETTKEEVVAYLTEKHGADFAAGFKTEYLSRTNPSK